MGIAEFPPMLLTRCGEVVSERLGQIRTTSSQPPPATQEFSGNDRDPSLPMPRATHMLGVAEPRFPAPAPRVRTTETAPTTWAQLARAPLADHSPHLVNSSLASPGPAHPRLQEIGPLNNVYIQIDQCRQNLRRAHCEAPAEDIQDG